MSKTKIVEIIKEKINKNEIKMKPKYFFVFGSLFISLGMVVSFVFSAFFINLISHRIRVQRLAEHLPMGGAGKMMFLQRFPWHFLLIAVALLAIGAWLLKRYDISYKRSFLIIVIGIVISVFCAGLIGDQLGINRHFEQRPGFKRLYKLPSGSFPNSGVPAVRGKVSPERKMPPRMYYRQ
ncbi:hypothetical protein ACFL15_01820 [Patescibacteria group bacterium]